MTKIYNYDPKTFEYINSENAELDPAELMINHREVPLVPAYATLIKPPAKRELKTRLFIENTWQVVDDFRGMYMVDDSMQPQAVTNFGALPEGYIPITEAQAQQIIEDDLYYVISDGKLIQNPNYEEEKQAREDAEFNKQFFNTSLGYVRRAVTMKDGSKKDFLCDILPLLAPGVPILTYTRELEQSQVITTEQFINECKQQMLIDFYGVQQNG